MNLLARGCRLARRRRLAMSPVKLSGISSRAQTVVFQQPIVIVLSHPRGFPSGGLEALMRLQTLPHLRSMAAPQPFLTLRACGFISYPANRHVPIPALEILQRFAVQAGLTWPRFSPAAFRWYSGVRTALHLQEVADSRMSMVWIFAPPERPDRWRCSSAAPRRCRTTQSPLGPPLERPEATTA